MPRDNEELKCGKLCAIIACCGAVLVFFIYLIAGILPPVPVDYTGARIIYDQEDLKTSCEDAADIVLSDHGITADAAGIHITGSNIRITKPGDYRLTGTLSNGCIYVSAQSGGTVHLLLSGVDLKNEEIPPIYISAADKVVITLEDGTENVLSATVRGGLESAVYSDCDLTFNGNGSLTAESGNGIAVNCETNVKFAGGSYEIRAKENGIRAKYGVSIQKGELNISSGADGIRTTAAGKSGGKWVGVVDIEGGRVNIASAEDAIQSSSIICMYDGELNIVSGGGSTEQEDTGMSGMRRPDEQNTNKSAESAKGMKAETGILIAGGMIRIDSADDTVHSDKDVTVTGGALRLYSNDDGIHGDASVTVSGGTVDVRQSYEGIEGHYIVIEGGDISVTASDDGMNATSGKNPIASFAKLTESEILGTGGRLIIKGGSIHLVSSGDGMDSNGSIIQTGGTVTVTCTSNGPESALDFDGTYSMTGGTLAAFGNGGMMQTITPQKSSAGCVTVGGTIQKGSVVSLLDENGDTLISAAGEEDTSCVLLASENLEEGIQVTAYIGEKEIGSAVISSDTALIGTITYSGGGPGGNTPDGSGPPGRELTSDGSTGPEGVESGLPGAADGNHNGMPGGGMFFLKWTPAVVIVILAVLTTIVLLRRKRRRKANDMSKRDQTCGQSR